MAGGRRDKIACWMPRALASLALCMGPFWAVLLPVRVLADCECGYVAVADGARHVFTDLIETDFSRLRDISANTDWAVQAFNMSRERARGEFGEMFAAQNVRLGSHGGDDANSGLELAVRSQAVEGMIPAAEIDSHRVDLLWGTFRMSMKLTDVPGTCAAFFWYFNDTQEIDMEFLSKDFNDSNASYPVNLVLQSPATAVAGYDARKAGTYVQALLPFDPTADFHEYRIDLLPGRVLFYAGAGQAGEKPLARIEGPAVPTSPGHLVLQHWSNGNKLWSGGPPSEDAVLRVAYAKAYFNSSAEQRGRDWAHRCKDERAAQAVCDIPDVARGDDASGPGWFFSDAHNMTNNQTVYGKNEGSVLSAAGLWRWPMLWMAIWAEACTTGWW